MHTSILSPPSDRGIGRMVDFIVYIVVSAALGSILYYGLELPVWAGSATTAIVLYIAETLLVYTKGASVGKLIVGERVTDHNGQPVTLGTAAVRALPRLLYAYIGLSFVAVAIGAVSAAMIFATEDRRSVMDRVAKTVVRHAADD